MKSARNILWIIIAATYCGGGMVRAEPPVTAADPPREFEGAGITEHLNEMAPLDVPFKDENGKDVTLRSYLKAGRPIIVTPVYYTCPGICNDVLNGLVNGLNDVEWSAGKEFEIVTFSIDPNDQPKLADLKKQAYLTQYRRPTAKDGWHFLTGTKESIDAMCKGIGFGFKPDGKGLIAHPASIIFLTPEGKIARYMNDVLYQPRDLKFALIESSQGAIGSPMEKFMLFMCYNYDPHSNSYSASAMKIMRLGGLVTVILMATWLSMMWWRSAHADAAKAAAESEATSEGREVKA
ncbi:MAG: SCO family protein [Phycisphaerales bacterium]|nr:SCO family protein [Phycisphaerales bacterium]MCI0631157.1 SCO family protein [Phycisphaerales bacterium]